MSSDVLPQRQNPADPGPRPRPEPGPGQGASTASSLVAPRPKQQRRPLLVVAMIVLVCLGGLVSAYAYTSMSESQDVVAVREPIARGEVIEPEDLVVVQVGVDPALSTIAGSDIDELIGQRASVDMPAGSLVAEGSVTESVLPADGQSVVGVTLTAAMMPAEPIYAGDMVRIVTTPGEQGEIVDDVIPVTIEAEVVGVRPVPDTGETVVDVAVDEELAADLASRAATRKVALVLDSRER